MRGIVNGTTNYMLTAMAREGRDYAEVLAEAQARGYAEADPTADVEGLDALNKLVILARLAFGAWIDPASRRQPARHDDRRRRARPGITGVTAEDVAALAARGPGRCACIATARLAEDGAIEASVVPDRGPGRLAVRALRRRAQPGRGGRRCRWAASRSRARAPVGPPPASAVLGDLVAIARGLGSTWAGSPAATELSAIAVRPVAVRMRRGAVRRLLPRRGLRRP